MKRRIIEIFVREEFRKRWEEKENERKNSEGERGGGWDIGFEDLSNMLLPSVMNVVKNEEESEIALNYLFNGMKVLCDREDHHSNYYYLGICCVDTTKAREIVNNSTQLREIINKNYEVKT